MSRRDFDADAGFAGVAPARRAVAAVRTALVGMARVEGAPVRMRARMTHLRERRTRLAGKGSKIQLPHRG